MSTEYDSAKIRCLAAQLGRTASAVNDVRQTSLQRITHEMAGNFQGEAADALELSVSELMADVTTLSTRIGEISKALYALAVRVDEADAKAKQIISSK